MYGLVAILASGLVLWVAGKFYGWNVFLHPVWTGIGFVGIFISAVFLRKHRKRLHTPAFHAEYQRDKDQDDPSS
jgi:multidrug transporter EmrE-like cation transporter